jgi:serine/threonine protein phosphatase PrpC
MKQCRSCGKENRVGASFCRYCGKPIVADNNTGVHPIHDGSGEVPLEEKVTLPFIEKPVAEETIILEPEVLTPTEKPETHPRNTEEVASFETVILPISNDVGPNQGADDLQDHSIGYETLILEHEVEGQDPDLDGDISKPENKDEKPPEAQPAGYETLILKPEIENQGQVINVNHQKIRDDDGSPFLENADRSGGEPILENITTEITPLNPESVGDPLDEQVLETGADAAHPLPSGYVLQARYRVLSVLAQDDNSTLYEVEDLVRCWNCGHVHASLEEIYCGNCGAAMEQRPILQLRETSIQDISGDDEPPVGVFIEGEYRYLIALNRESKRDESPPVFQMAVGFQSDRGEVRDVDEDSLLVMQLNAVCEMGGLPSLNTFAVADGIGGTEAGEVASKIAIRTLATKCLDNIFSPELAGRTLSPDEIKTQLKDAVSSANLDILAAIEEYGTDMGCTLTMAFIRDDQAVFLNVGDSRIYLMRMGELSQITEDHSVVAKLLSQNKIQPEEVYSHEQKSVIYRSLGDKPDLEVEDSIVEVTLEPGDRMVLCCDGMWEMVPDSFIEDVLLEYFDPQAACDLLVEMANQAGGDDNISVIVVNVQTLKRFR